MTLEATMTARLPETLDGVVLTTADQAEELLASLRHLESFVDERLGRNTEHAFGHSGDEVPRRIETEEFAHHVAVAIESIESVRQSLEEAKQLRARCQDHDDE